MGVLKIRNKKTGQFEPVTTIKGEKGDKGEPGEKGLNWRGEWQEMTDYTKGDAVSRNGTSYVLISEGVPSGLPPEDYPEDWEVLARGGDTGPQGPKGDAGETGPRGPAYTLNAADKAAITAAVIEGLPVYAGEVV